MNKKMEDLRGGDVIHLDGWIWASEYGGYTHVNGNIDMSSHGYSRICPVKVVGVVPDGFNAIETKVAAIDAAVERLKEEYHQSLARLDDAKQKLLALPAPQTTTAEANDDFPF